MLAIAEPLFSSREGIGYRLDGWLGSIGTIAGLVYLSFTLRSPEREVEARGTVAVPKVFRIVREIGDGFGARREPSSALKSALKVECCETGGLAPWRYYAYYTLQPLNSRAVFSGGLRE